MPSRLERPLGTAGLAVERRSLCLSGVNDLRGVGDWAPLRRECGLLEEASDRMLQSLRPEAWDPPRRRLPADDGARVLLLRDCALFPADFEASLRSLCLGGGMSCC